MDDERPARVLVLGIGNILLSDEGVGVRTVEAMQSTYVLPAGVEILDGGTAGMDLLSLIAGRERLIVIDAVHFGEAPGTIRRLDGDAIAAAFGRRLSPHQLGLLDVLAAARLLDEAPGEITLFGIEPQSLELSLELTPVIAAQLGPLCTLIADELSRIGLRLRPASAD